MTASDLSCLVIRKSRRQEALSCPSPFFPAHSSVLGQWEDRWRGRQEGRKEDTEAAALGKGTMQAPTPLELGPSPSEGR